MRGRTVRLGPTVQNDPKYFKQFFKRNNSASKVNCWNENEKGKKAEALACDKYDCLRFICSCGNDVEVGSLKFHLTRPISG